MRTGVVVFFFATALLSATSHAQPKAGAFELGTSVDMGFTSSSYEMSGSFSASGDSESEGFLALAIRPGYYVATGLSIEPEFLWTAVEGERPGFSLAGNLSYTFPIENSPVLPFLLAGYGRGNTIPTLGIAMLARTDGWDVSLLNAGAGIKVFASSAVAVRMEYRYRRYSTEETYGGGFTSGTMTFTRQFHAFLIGLSLFLPS
jgi:opacity protein-like surface antigen